MLDFQPVRSKTKQIASCTRDFSRALRKLTVTVRNSDWFITLFAPVVIGQGNWFGYCFFDSLWKTPLSRVYVPGRKCALRPVVRFSKVAKLFRRSSSAFWVTQFSWCLQNEGVSRHETKVYSYCNFAFLYNMKRPALQNERVGVLRLTFRDFGERGSLDARLTKGFYHFCQNCPTGSEMQRINAAELTSCMLKLPIFSFV